MTVSYKTPATDVPFGQMPHWMLRTGKLSHTQFRIMAALLAGIGNRGTPQHLTYTWLAEWASTDKNTVTKAMALFTENGWVEITGKMRNFRRYKLNLDKMRSDLMVREYEAPDA